MHGSKHNSSTSRKYFSPNAEQLVFAEKCEFGRKVMKAILALLNEICVSQNVAFTLSKLKRMAIIPASL